MSEGASKAPLSNAVGLNALLFRESIEHFVLKDLPF